MLILNNPAQENGIVPLNVLPLRTIVVSSSKWDQLSGRAPLRELYCKFNVQRFDMFHHFDGNVPPREQS
jgi:hypothetical protein